MSLTIVFDLVNKQSALSRRQISVTNGSYSRGVGGQCSIVGALSIGEMASTSRGTINLNKSTVVGNL
jgi:hypothetical protein